MENSTQNCWFLESTLFYNCKKSLEVKNQTINTV